MSNILLNKKPGIIAWFFIALDNLIIKLILDESYMLLKRASHNICVINTSC